MTQLNLAGLVSSLNSLAEAIQNDKHLAGPLTIADMIEAFSVTHVVGKNLIEGSDNFEHYKDGTGKWAVFQVSTIGVEQWDGLALATQDIGGLIGKKITWEPGTYTFSVFARLTKDDPKAKVMIGFVGGTRIEKEIPEGKMTSSMQRFYFTVTLQSENVGRFQISLASSSTDAKLDVCGEKVEQGTQATDYVTALGKTVNAPLVKVDG